jgi:hypothetical protein
LRGVARRARRRVKTRHLHSRRRLRLACGIGRRFGQPLRRRRSFGHPLSRSLRGGGRRGGEPIAQHL